MLNLNIWLFNRFISVLILNVTLWHFWNKYTQEKLKFLSSGVNPLSDISEWLSKAGTVGSSCLWHLHFAWQTRGMHPWWVDSFDDSGLRLLAYAARKAREWKDALTLFSCLLYLWSVCHYVHTYCISSWCLNKHGKGNNMIFCTGLKEDVEWKVKIHKAQSLKIG